MDSQFAKRIGRRGGLARARKLSAEERRKIASKGGQIRALSAKAAERIEANFRRLAEMYKNNPPPRVKSVSRVLHRLPSIRDK